MTRIDLRLTPELASRITAAAETVGQTYRSWARAALLRAARSRYIRIGYAPKSGSARLGIPMLDGHRARILDAAYRADLSLSDWVRAALDAAADVDLLGR